MHPSEDNIEIRPQNEYCASHHMTIFVGSIYAYKGLLMVRLISYKDDNLEKFNHSIFNALGFWMFSGVGNTQR